MKWNGYRVLLLYKAERGAIVCALLLLLLGTVTGILKPWPIAFLLDYVLGGKDIPGCLGGQEGCIGSLSKAWQICLCAGAIFVLHLLSSGITSLQNYLVIRIGLKGLRRIRQQVFSWIQQLSQQFFLRRRQGDVIYRVCWDTYSFQTLFQHVWFSSAASFVSMLSMLWVMWYVNELLTLISCITLPMMVLGMRVYGRTMHLRSVEAHKADSQVASYIQQTISSIAAIQSFVRQKKTEERFGVYNHEAWAKRLRQHASEIAYQSTVAVVFSFGMAGIIWAGANEVHAGRLTVGELVVFITYLSQFYEPLQKLIAAGTTMADARAGVGRVFEVLDTKPDIASPAHPVEMQHVENKGFSVDFQDVSFGYEPERMVLRNLSFSVQPGEFVAIVGPSGAGKTTLAQLVPRFFDPNTGQVKINGVNIREYDLDALRRVVSVVHQEPLLLPGTIRENILFGREDASEQDLQTVAHLVHADEFIAQLPQQYNTPVGDGECRLSVGEMQRICLARALLKDAPILILDEPTSSLDAENQMIVVNAFSCLAKGKTTFMIAHRLSTLANASKIIVLVDGRIQAIGTHEELLQTSDYYKRAVVASQRAVNVV